jgi:sialate O-acetylesterase
VVLLLAALTATDAWGDVRLPALIGDEMVLQRDVSLPIWGWAEPGETIAIKFHGMTRTTTANKSGRWSVRFGPYAAGGPYEMTIQGRNSLSVHGILIGDVWLASGQSNMEFPLKPEGDWMRGVNNAEQEIASARFPSIRLFKVHKIVRFSATDDVDADSWIAASPESAADFSAVAYLFGRELHRRYGVPIGLIEAAWGGTVAEAWVSEAGLRPFPEFQESLRSMRFAGESSLHVANERYVKRKAAWNNVHGAEDRGLSNGRAQWADPAFDTGAWPRMDEPQQKPISALGGFDTTVWFRRDVMIPDDEAGSPARVHLVTAGKSDITYFNGEMIGQTDGWEKPRDYLVPSNLVRGGRNVIASRMTGEQGYIGFLDFDNPNKLNFEVAGQKLPLAGAWSYQPGPDLTEMPRPSRTLSLALDHNRPAALFDSMIHPLVNFRIKGVIWYQGEANADDHGRAEQYRALFPALIQDWRKQWGFNVPFLFVQLAGYGHNKSQPAEYPWAELREAQSMALSLPDTGMATAIDLGEEDDIHPRDKQDVAHRLALVAARVVYGENIVDSGPMFQSMKIIGSLARITLTDLGDGLRIDDKYGYIRGFEIAGSDGEFQWAQARLDGREILVDSPGVAQPVAVRYDWSNTPDGNLFNEEGLPTVPFRTDRRQ